MRKYYLTILLLKLSFFGDAQLYIGENALLHITEGANLEVGPDLENNGAIQNLGTLSLFGNWTVNNNFNGSVGELQFLGSEDQMILTDDLVIKELTVNSLGAVNFPGDEYIVTDRIEFIYGTVETGENTRFVLAENASVIGGSNNSYFEGSLISKGSGIKIFPVGSEGVYAPLTLLDVFGNDVEIEASHKRNIPVDPEPGDSLLGVSYKGYWELELINGVSDDTHIQLEFNQEDLSDFKIFNNIRYRSNTPAVAFTSNLVSRWQSLDVEELIDTDSLTYGKITSGVSITPELNDKLYFAIGLAPTVPENLRPYIPEIFSPNATDPDNRAFKIFGENISSENFSLQVYNKLGVQVYSTNSMVEAKENGWDGTNPSGAEEPTGIYYYSVRLTYGRGLTFNDSGVFYLIR